MCRRFTMLTFAETLEVLRCLEAGTPCELLPAWPLDHPLDRGTTIFPPISHDPMLRVGKTPRTDALPGSRVNVIVLNCADPNQLAAPRKRHAQPGRWGAAFDDAELFGRYGEGQAAGPNTATASPLHALSERSFFATAQLAWGFAPNWEQKLIYNARIETAATSRLWHDACAQRRCLVPTWGFFEMHASEFGFNSLSHRMERQLYHFFAQPFPLTLMAGIYEQGRFSVLTTESPDSFSDIHNRIPVTVSESRAYDWLIDGMEALDLNDVTRLSATPVLAKTDAEFEQLQLFVC